MSEKFDKIDIFEKIEYIEKLFKELCDGIKECQNQTATSKKEKEDLEKRLTEKQKNLDDAATETERKIRELEEQGRRDLADKMKERQEEIDRLREENEKRITNIQNDIIKITNEKETIQKEYNQEKEIIKQEHNERENQLREASEAQKAAAANKLSRTITLKDLEIAALKKKLAKEEQQKNDCQSKLKDINIKLGNLNVCTKKLDKLHEGTLNEIIKDDSENLVNRLDGELKRIDEDQEFSYGSNEPELSTPNVNKETTPNYEEITQNLLNNIYRLDEDEDEDEPEISTPNVNKETTPNDKQPYRSQTLDLSGGRRRKNKKTKRKKSKKSKRKSKKR